MNKAGDRLDRGEPAGVAQSGSSWEERNNDYLAERLDWLRERLVDLAGRPGEDALDEASPFQPAPKSIVENDSRLALETPKDKPALPPAEPKRSLWRRWFGNPEPPQASRPPDAELAAELVSESAIAPGTVSSSVTLTSSFDPSALLEDAGPPMSEEAPTFSEDQPPALVELAGRLDLSEFEQDTLLLAAAGELDPEILELCARVPGRQNKPFPSFGLALQMFHDPEWEALAPHRPLRRLQLVTLPRGFESVVNAQLRADERIVNLLKGIDHIDERLTELFLPMSTLAAALETPASQRNAAQSIARWARAGPDNRIVCLSGPHSASKRLVAELVASELGVFAVRLPVTNLPPPGAEFNQMIRLWERDSLLSPIALYLEVPSQAGELAADTKMAADRLLTRANGLVFIDSREVWSGLDSGAQVVEVANPTPAEQRRLWNAALPPEQGALASDLAASFDLDVFTIGKLSTTAAQLSGFAEAESDQWELWRAVRLATRPTLELMGKRTDPKVSASELILPSEVMEQLERIKEQVRHRSTVYHDWGMAERMSRGLGISALFSGESGTGKTFAAEVIAAELNLDLYRIDLSGVVSKYIGETEKNLRQVFDAAEHGGTILCFDEADALFGKRSEVKDSHDRYANIEVNYLLQRMEDFSGLAILTTNMKSALDRAFTRRLRFIVDFPFPGPTERELIWRQAFTSPLKTERLDFSSLARLTLAGGSIKNVAVNATFAAAAQPGHELTMPMVLSAARLEYRKNGMPLNEAAFHWEEPAMAAGLER